MSRRAAIAALVFVVALIVYLLTLAPTVALIGSGELTDAAWSLGNAHPPGFPLFVLVTHFFTLLPIRSVAWRTNFASAIFSAAAAAFASLAACEVLSGAPPPSAARAAEGHASRDVRRTPFITGGLVDGTIRYDDEVVPNELVPTYRAAFLSRARDLAVTRHFQDAIADDQQALAFDPQNRMLEQKLLAVQQAAMR